MIEFSDKRRPPHDGTFSGTPVNPARSAKDKKGRVMDELAALRLFTKVVQSGSFSKVGRLTGSSTSSVSRSVTKLEEALGVRLLNRTTRQLVLTEAGQRFHADATRILESIEEAKRAASAYQEGVRGEIRVHAAVDVGKSVLLPALPRFLAQHPEATVNLTLTDSRVNIVSEKVDVAIWRGGLDNSSLVGRLLATPRRLLCGSPEYFARHGKPRVPTDLRRHNCLLYVMPLYSNEWIFERDGDVTTVPVSGNLKTNSGDALLNSMLAGVGLAVLPEWIVSEVCRQGLAQAVLADYDIHLTGKDTSLYLVYAHRASPPQVSAFIQFVLHLFGKGVATNPI